MPRFKVYRCKRYEAFIDATTASIAVTEAQDVLGREWILVEDKVEHATLDLDTPHRWHDSPFKE